MSQTDLPPLVLEGLLVAAPPGRVRLVIDDTVLELDRRDVVDIAERPSPPDLVADQAIAARVTFCPAPRLLNVTSARKYRELLWSSREPFVLASRGPVDFAYPAEYRRAEEAFLVARTGGER
ncbi:MAG TPA: hypothetical protein VN947_13795 [Polyangia bacterium]|nr:hypothetical protein [Polyangia bacterium]